MPDFLIICSVVIFLVHRYILFQAISAFVVLSIVMTIVADYLMLTWFALILWTGINVILSDAMSEQSRSRLVL